MRIVVSFIAEDYFTYVGTSPMYSEEERVRESLPSEFRNFSSMKYKIDRTNRYSLSSFYFVILIIEVEEELVKKVINTCAGNMRKVYNFKYRILKS